MKVAVKKIDTLKRELKFEINRERVAQTLDAVYKDISKVTKIKGFRPGKAPRHVLEASHKHLAQEETIKKIIPEAFQEGIIQEKIDPIDMPDIEDVNFKDGTITFTAKIEIRPEVTVKDYKGIKVKRKDSKVTEEEIQKTLDYFKQAQGGEKQVKIDDDFAKRLGYPTLEEFKKTLVRQMEMDKDRQNRFDIENQLIEAALKKTKVTAPESLVKKQTERRVAEALDRLKKQGMPEEEIQKKEKEIRKDLPAAVERDIKVYLMLDKIAQLESIEVKEGENLPAKVIEFLLKEANWEGEKK